MTSRRLRSFVDAVAAGRRPRGYQSEAEEAAVIRAAIALRAARPGEDAPREDFVAGLFERLSTEQRTAAEPTVPTRSVRPRQRALVGATAAAAVLVTGSVVATEQLAHRGTSTPVPALSAAAVRTGSFQTTDGQVLGQVVAYRGRPSWIFMNVDVPRYDGQIVCKLQIADGTVVAFGTFNVHQGVGQFSRSFKGVDVSELRGARLFGASGATVASATFTG